MIVFQTVLALALIVVIYLRERSNAAERQSLLDRIQAPHSAQVAAMNAVAGERPPREPVDVWEDVALEGDLEILSMLDGEAHSWDHIDETAGVKS